MKFDIKDSVLAATQDGEISRVVSKLIMIEDDSLFSDELESIICSHELAEVSLIISTISISFNDICFIDIFLGK